MADLQVTHYGSITELTGLTPDGRSFLREYADTEPWQWRNETIVVEPRMASDLIEAAQDLGLAVVA